MNFSNLKSTSEAVKYMNNWIETNERFVIVEKFESRLKLGTDNNNELVYVRFLNKDGELHRNNDNPSVITKDVIMWHKNNKLHRKHNKPAIVRNSSQNSSDYNTYFQNLQECIGNMHFGFPKEEYFVDGLRHRDFDLPAVFFDKNHSIWYKDGLIHRDNNKPALINGDFLFFYKNGIKYKEEVVYGNKITNWIIKNPIIVCASLFIIISLITFCFSTY